MSYRTYDIDGNASDRFAFTNHVDYQTITTEIKNVYTHTFTKNGLAIITAKQIYGNSCPKFVVCKFDNNEAYSNFTIQEGVKYHDSQVSFVYRVKPNMTMDVSMAGYSTGGNKIMVTIIEIET